MHVLLQSCQDGRLPPGAMRDGDGGLRSGLEHTWLPAASPHCRRGLPAPLMPRGQPPAGGRSGEPHPLGRTE